MKRIIFIFALLLSLSSCSPKVYNPISSRDSSYYGHRDSIYVRDSIYIDRTITIREKGDTIYITEFQDRYRDRWRDRVVVDTLWRDKAVEITVPVEKPLTWWQKLWITLGKVFAGILAGVVLVFVIRILVRK